MERAALVTEQKAKQQEEEKENSLPKEYCREGSERRLSKRQALRSRSAEDVHTVVFGLHHVSFFLYANFIEVECTPIAWLTSQISCFLFKM